ncbi:hypothetical protein [Cetobacterium sp.]|uniref:hypothetical protein n=1 Tax=Cetobacterium sp. TaxID=2071632 RepID=UPI003F33A877
MKEFIKKYWKGFLTVTIFIFIFNLIETKFFNGTFNLWENIKLIIITFVAIIISKKI